MSRKLVLLNLDQITLRFEHPFAQELSRNVCLHMKIMRGADDEEAKYMRPKLCRVYTDRPCPPIITLLVWLYFYGFAKRKQRTSQRKCCWLEGKKLAVKIFICIGVLKAAVLCSVLLNL